MIIPPKLKPGDRVAIVSLSSGMLGEPENSHILTLGQKRLAEFGLEPVLMPNALKGRAYLKADGKNEELMYLRQINAVLKKKKTAVRTLGRLFG